MKVKIIDSPQRELRTLPTGALFKVQRGDVVYMKIRDEIGGNHLMFKTSVVSLPSGYLYRFECDKQIIPYDGELTIWQIKEIS